MSVLKRKENVWHVRELVCGVSGWLGWSTVINGVGYPAVCEQIDELRRCLGAGRPVVGAGSMLWQVWARVFVCWFEHRQQQSARTACVCAESHAARRGGVHVWGLRARRHCCACPLFLASPHLFGNLPPELNYVDAVLEKPVHTHVHARQQLKT